MTGIVVGVDGSEGAAHALAWAVQEAAAHRLPLTAVLARDDQGAGGIVARSEGAALALLDRYVIDAVGEAKASSVRRRTDDHRASRALLDASLGASLLVIGPRGLGNFRGALLGSVSERCVHHAACPVAIVHRTDAIASGMERIVVGVDGSEGAQSALAWAEREARLQGARMDVVHAWTLPYSFGFPYTSANFDPSWIEESARATLDAAVGGIDTDGLAHPVEAVLVSGGATPAILEQAKGADLIVVGSRGVGGFGGLLLGSVSHQVAHHATVPVVVVPRKA